MTKLNWLVGASVLAVALTGCSASTSTELDVNQGDSTVVQSEEPTSTPTPTPTPTPTRTRPRGKALWEPAPGDTTVYLTFDDGPWYLSDEVLDILKENDVRATFFQIGKMIRTREAVNERIFADGHAIGNHTWDHIDLAVHSKADVRYQLEATDEAIGPRGGACMRPPFGSLDDAARAISQKLGLTPVLWNVDTNDWDHKSESSIYKSLMKIQPGDVVLMHDGGGDRENTVEALRRALPVLKAKGYVFDSVPVCRQPGQ